ncbi:hypothetical protein BJF78_16040 [Pseudonocardia sp. CNS-139]|nr:hypothetical protein BJF78_16040 [Pseudonocardia sp. CNS-139]
MTRVVVEISPSVDGYVAGEGVSVERPFGDAGQRLHRWLGFDGDPDPQDVAAAGRSFGAAGAVVIGRRMFDVGIAQWGPDGAFGLPVFVVTSRPEPDLVRGPTTFAFVTGGVRAAVERAGTAAGDREVVVGGGAAVVQQALDAGLVDELRLHVVPVLLGRGTRLFERTPGAELVPSGVVVTRNATHTTYRVARPA